MRRTRTLTALFASLVLLLSSLPMLASADPGAEDSGDIADFGACMSGHGSGSLVLLIDQSGSLRQSDPDKARVTAAQYLLDRLSQSAMSRGYTLDVRVAGFAADYRPVGDWAALTPSSLGQFNEAVTAVGDDLLSHDTDYWTALEGARQDLASHDTSGCQAVLWFSDGQFDLDVRSSSSARQQFGIEKPYAAGYQLTDDASVAAVEELGREDLCRPAGLADQLRAQRITLIGVGLTSAESDFSLMQRMTLGGGENATSAGVDSCGDLASPRGSFYSAADIDALLLAFDAISTPGDSTSRIHSRICQGEICTDGDASFVLDDTLTQVHLLATSDVSGLQALLIPPTADGSEGTPIALTPGTGPQNAEGVSYEWLSERTLQVDLDRADLAVWRGQWRVVFVDPSSNSDGREVTINVHLSSPIALEWVAPEGTVLHAGESPEGAHFVLHDRVGGNAMDTAALTSTVTVSAHLTDAQGHDVVLLPPMSVIELPSEVSIPEQAAIGAGTITSTVQVTTTSLTTADGSTIPGTVLEPTQLQVPVEISAPLNFPTLSGALSFGTLEKELSAQASLPVSGPGCVWVEQDALSTTGVPAQAGIVQVTSPEHATADTCLQVPAGDSTELPLTLSVGGHANGGVSGTLQVSMSADGDSNEVRSVSVPVTAELRRPLNVATAWGTFAAVLLAGILLPLLVLYLLKYLSTRMAPGSLVVKRYEFQLPQGQERLSLPPEAGPTQATSLSGRTRRHQLEGATLEARMGLSPTSVPYVLVTGTDGVSLSSFTPSSVKDQACLPLFLRGHWVAILHDLTSSPRLTLILLGSTRDMDCSAALRRAESTLLTRVRARLSQGTGSGTSTSGSASSSSETHSAALGSAPVVGAFGAAGGTQSGTGSAPSAFGTSPAFGTGPSSGTEGPSAFGNSPTNPFTS